MTDTSALDREQKFFDLAWERREDSRASAKQSGLGGHRHDQVSLNAANRRYLEVLAPAEVEVAHGSITLEDGETLYVGRNTIWDVDKDVLVINWRSDIGELYERATVKDPRGVTIKRTFHTKPVNRVQGFDDAVFAELLERVSELSMFQQGGAGDALLEDLNAGRTGTMRDIVKTIQASQSELIRHDPNALLVVQGGPGTGKSAVALHRVSWLLFNEDGLQPDDVLVIGPTDTFTNYIKDVLPGLGDADVPQLSLRRLGPLRSSRRDEVPETARLKGQETMAGLIERALHLRIRFAGSDAALTIGGARATTSIPRDEIEQKLDELRQAPTYSSGRAQMRTWLTDRATGDGDGRFGMREAPDAQAIDVALNRVWPNLSPQQFLQELLGSRDRLLDAGGDYFSATEITHLHRQAAPNMASELWSDTDVALLDEADHRINGAPKRYKHIVIDEAQDLSPMQLRSIRRRSVAGACTVVGDMAQSTGPWARDSWQPIIDGLQQNAPVFLHELDYGYRVPAEIYAIAERLLPLIAPDLKPLTVVRNAPEEPRFILDDGDYDVVDETIEAIQEHAIKGRFLGVVVAPEHHDLLAAELRERGINFSDADSGSLGASVNLITASEAKGLEFDAVVVVEPAAIAAIDEHGLRLLYIALTRATKYLTVVHAREFEPLGLSGAPPLPASEPSNLDRILATGEKPAVVTTAPASSMDERTQDAASSAHQQSVGTHEPLNPLLAAVATTLAHQVKDGVPPHKWAAVVEEVVRQLGLEAPR